MAFPLALDARYINKVIEHPKDPLSDSRGWGVLRGVRVLLYRFKACVRCLTTGSSACQKVSAISAIPKSPGWLNCPCVFSQWTICSREINGSLYFSATARFSLSSLGRI